MDSWSAYCAICGGPFFGIQFRRVHHRLGEGTWLEFSSDFDEQDELSESSDSSDENGDSMNNNLDSDLSDDGESDSVSDHDPIALSDTDTGSDGLEQGSQDWDQITVPSEGDDESELESAYSGEDLIWDDEDVEMGSETNQQGINNFEDGSDSDQFNSMQDPERYYDWDVIQSKDTTWIKIAFGLCYNPAATGPSKSFLARGIVNKSGTMRVLAHHRGMRDPNHPARKFSPNPIDCYDRNPETFCFPMHSSCLELFALYITGYRLNINRLVLGVGPFSGSGSDCLDKDALYFALRILGDGCVGSLPVSYGPLADTCQQLLWESRRGYECLVANPSVEQTDDIDKPWLATPSNLVRTVLRNHISRSGGFTRTFLSYDLSSKVKFDRFSKLPYDVLCKITHFLDDKSLMSLCSASWHVHCTFRHDSRLWRHRIKRVSMPWLLEVVPLLQDQELMKGVDLKGLLCSLDELTRPRVGMTGIMMGVANRRRIWDVCRIIGEEYTRMVAVRKAMGSEAVMEQLLKASRGEKVDLDRVFRVATEDPAHSG